MGKIFISYSRKDKKWKELLLKHLKIQEMEGGDSIWEDTQIQTGNDWLPEIMKNLNEADTIILMISADFLTSNFIHRVEIPTALERRKKEGVRVIPLLLRPCDWKCVDWLSKMQMIPEDNKALSGMNEHDVELELTNLAECLRRVRGAHTLLESETPNPTEEKTRAVQGGGGSMPQISLSKLPTTGQYLFGREKELKMLDEAWENNQTKILALIAWGGVGKTSLVNHWLNHMQKDRYRGAQRTYGWSFYSQGAEEGRQVSADSFLQETLEWFGDPNPQEGTSVAKGRRLARLVQQEKTLLILDGMEPLQYPPGEVQGFVGKCKDQGMRAFLRELSMGTSGLCLITSRETIADLTDKRGHSVEEKNLEHLDHEAGKQLLKKLGVTGSDTEIRKAVKEYGGHALALTLLGQFIKAGYKGDIRKRDTIPALMDEHQQGGHARRVMAAYGHWLGDSVERDILYMLGLFDRPADAGAIEALTAEPPIAGVSEQLTGIDAPALQTGLTHLRDAGLLGWENPLKPGALDCHPLVREHFGEQLKQDNPDGWQEANQRLYHYYKDLPEKELPDTLQEMEPLFAAVAHGCRAGLYRKVMSNVCWKRISMGSYGFIVKKMGAIGSYLSVLSHFFAKPWGEPATELTEVEKAFILSWAAFGLRAVGRLTEALQPMKASMELHINQKNWKEAALNASNLSALLLTLGRTAEAVDRARQSVRFADRTDEWGIQLMYRTTLGDALHQAGEAEEAEQWFREAEALQKERHPEYPFLYALQGFRFCDLLLGRGQWDEVTQRAEKALRIAKNVGFSLLSIALDHLTLGRSGMLGGCPRIASLDDF